VDVAEPAAASGEAVVRIEACGVCGSDLNAWRGVPGIEYPLGPGAPGHETVGEVVALGDGVSSLRVGDRVTGLMWNGLAEYGVARAENLVVLPSAKPGLLGEPLACAMNVLRRSGLRAGERFSIVGFGYLAALLVHLLPAPAPWVAISRREDSRELALRLGAEAAYGFDSVPSVLWDSFGVTIEAAGVQQTLDFATWLTSYGGRLVIAGYHADGPRTVNMQSWNWKGMDVINAHERQPAAYVEALRSALGVVAARQVDFSFLHTHRLPLGEAPGAFELAERRPAGFVKAIVCP
jgi:threonine dehydrogenase-like Zn-dependent dehydrogenase